jgi:hypothetical protein
MPRLLEECTEKVSSSSGGEVPELHISSQDRLRWSGVVGPALFVFRLNRTITLHAYSTASLPQASRQGKDDDRIWSFFTVEDRGGHDPEMQRDLEPGWLLLYERHSRSVPKVLYRRPSSYSHKQSCPERVTKALEVRILWRPGHRLCGSTASRKTAGESQQEEEHELHDAGGRTRQRTVMLANTFAIA